MADLIFTDSLETLQDSSRRNANRSEIPVSIVIPILNEARNLPKLLDGLARQTYLPREIVFSDAGSTDGSAQLAEIWWRENGVPQVALHVLHCPGALPGAGRNYGVCASASPWIAFIDGGIVPEPDWLENLYSYALGRNVRAVFGVCEFEAEGAIPRAVCALSNGYHAIHPVLPASLFARELFDEIGYFREDLRSAEDLRWMADLERIIGAREICASAQVHYFDFPQSLGAVFRKWRLGEANSVRVGVRGIRQKVYLFGIPIGIVLSLVNPLFLVVYGLARGVLDPLRRSGWRIWWKGQPAALPLTIVLAFVIDAGKWLGIVDGLLTLPSRNVGR